MRQLARYLLSTPDNPGLSLIPEKEKSSSHTVITVDGEPAGNRHHPLKSGRRQPGRTAVQGSMIRYIRRSTVPGG